MLGRVRVSKDVEVVVRVLKVITKVGKSHTNSIDLPEVVGVTTEIFVKTDLLSTVFVEDSTGTRWTLVGHSRPVRENAVVRRTYRVDQRDSFLFELLFSGIGEVISSGGRVGTEVASYLFCSLTVFEVPGGAGLPREVNGSSEMDHEVEDLAAFIGSERREVDQILILKKHELNERGVNVTNKDSSVK